MADPRSRYTWDSRTGQYRGPGGRFIPRREIREAMDKALDEAASRMRDMSDALRQGKMSLPKWQNAMRREMKNIHLWNAAGARGGWAQMSAADFGRLGPAMKRQYQYLERFAVQIEQGLPLDGRFLRRAEMYAEAGRGTYHQVDELAHRERGHTQERNILDAGAESCGECEDESSRGWVPIGELVPIGGRTCKTRCRCFIEYRGGDTAG